VSSFKWANCHKWFGWYRLIWIQNRLKRLNWNILLCRLIRQKLAYNRCISNSWVNFFRLFFITPVFEFRSSFDLEAAYTLMELQLVSLDQELVVSKHQFLVGFWNTIAIIEGNHHLLVLHRVEILNSFGVILCKWSIESGPSLEGDQSVWKWTVFLIMNDFFEIKRSHDKADGIANWKGPYPINEPSDNERLPRRTLFAIPLYSPSWTISLKQFKSVHLLTSSALSGRVISKPKTAPSMKKQTFIFDYKKDNKISIHKISILAVEAYGTDNVAVCDDRSLTLTVHFALLKWVEYLLSCFYFVDE